MSVHPHLPGVSLETHILLQAGCRLGFAPNDDTLHELDACFEQAIRKKDFAAAARVAAGYETRPGVLHQQPVWLEGGAVLLGWHEGSDTVHVKGALYAHSPQDGRTRDAILGPTLDALGENIHAFFPRARQVPLWTFNGQAFIENGQRRSALDMLNGVRGIHTASCLGPYLGLETDGKGGLFQPQPPYWSYAQHGPRPARPESARLVSVPMARVAAAQQERLDIAA